MTADSQPRDAYTPAGNWLFFIIVALAYGSVFVSAPTLPTSFKEITLLALGILYVVIGTAGMAWCERAGRRWTVPAYFVVQIILSAVIIFLTLDQSGLMAIIAYPLAAHGVVLLPTRWMIAVCVAIVAVLVVPVGVVAGWANGFEAALGFSAGMIFVVLFTQIAVKEERARNKVERLADELGRANQKLRQYAVQAEELATTQERNRLAREIHDSLGHYLTVINVQLEAARAVLPHNRAQALDALGKAQTLTQEGLREVRRSVAALRASPLEKRTLPEAVQALADECRAAGIATGLTITGPRRHLPPQAKLALYRAAQEGLTNVRKHSGATRTHLTLDYSDPAVIRLTVQDNGTGPSEPGVTTGFGLLGVRERIELLGGRVDTQAQPGQGFTLMVETPTNTGGSPDEQPAD